MRGRIPLAIAAVAVLSLALPGSAGAGVTITVNDDFFAPKKQSAAPGNPVFWGGNTANEHNIHQDQGLFGSGTPTDHVNFMVTASAGTFSYFCDVHGGKGGVGMSGKLKVTPQLVASGKRRAGQVIGVAWADNSSTGDQYDVRYKGPGTDGKYKTWLKNTELERSDFGLNDEPTRVKPGKTYYFQARSESSSTDKHSGWSPALKFDTEA